MLMNRGQQYALLALQDLAAQPPGTYVLGRDIGQRLGIPGHYLGKILQALARGGVLESSRGRSGGFRLSHKAARTTIRDVLTLLDGGRSERECLLGLKDCSDQDACALHCQWRPIKEELGSLLEERSVLQLGAMGTFHLL